MDADPDDAHVREPFRTTGTRKVLDYIERTLSEVTEQIRKGADGDPTITLKRVERYEAVLDEAGSSRFRAKDHEVKYSFPGKTGDEAWRFSGNPSHGG